MTVVSLRPGTVSGRLVAPPSKSYTHRAVVAGHLAGRRYRIDRPLDAGDTRASLRAVSRLGTPVVRGRSSWTIRPARSHGPHRSVTVDCGESGTTLRFVAALAALHDAPVVLRGAPRLSERPLESLLRSLEGLGARVRRAGEGLPVEITGPMHGGPVHLDTSESSQFASALLLALPTRIEDSALFLEGRPVSRPYIEATMALLAHHGIRLRRRGRRISIPGGQRYRRSRFAVPGDASSAAYFWAAAAITGGDVEVRGISPAAVWPQADFGILSILRRQGAEVRTHRERVRVRGGPLRPFSADLTDTPDLYPLLGVLAAVTPGPSELRGAAHVAVKESDRRAGTIRLARALGARVRVAPDRLRIEGTRSVKPLTLRDLTDHRMLMSAAVGALVARGRSTLGERNVVAKSYPNFWDALETVTGQDGPA